MTEIEIDKKPNCDFCDRAATGYLETNKGDKIYSCDNQECKKAAMLKQFRMNL